MDLIGLVENALTDWTDSYFIGKRDPSLSVEYGRLYNYDY